MRAPPRRRNACAPAASTTTSTMSATPRATTPSSRCSAISRSATISRTAPSSSPGTWSPRSSGCRRTGLWITVYVDDDQAFDLWKKIAGLPESRIIRIAGADNFWAMGDTGPCGPCSEIFYDHGPQIPGGPPGSPDAEGDRFIEIWNLVFMQYEQLAGGKRVDLPKPSIDTGMGLERIAAVLQGTHDNYKIDLFGAIISHVADLTGVDADGPQAASHRVIADHLRASAFLIADGVLPSNEGRGYVLRRIMRRAMRHAELLGAKEPLMWRLVPTLTREMGQAYPELVRAEPLISETLKLEETRFRKTLERGLAILDEESRGLKQGDRLKGETAFTLYDTYGFPLDLTQDALKPRGITVDTDAFNAAMERQREKARASWAGSGEAATEAVWFALREQGRCQRIPGLRDRKRRGRGRGAGQGRQGSRRAQARRERRRYPQSDAVLRRIRRPGRRHRRHERRRRALSRRRYPEEGGRRVRAFRHRRAGHAQGRRGARARGRSWPPQRHPPAPFGDPPPARGAAPGARRPRGAEGLAGRARPAALRFLASQADERARRSSRSRTSPTTSCCKIRRSPRA